MTHPSTTFALAVLALCAALFAVRVGGEAIEHARLAHFLPRPRKPKGNR